MRKAVAIAVLTLAGLSVPDTASAEACAGGGLPGLATVASKLKVRPSVGGMLYDCSGMAYDVGSILLAAVNRIEKAEAAANEAKSEAALARADGAAIRSMFTPSEAFSIDKDHPCWKSPDGCVRLLPNAPPNNYTPIPKPDPRSR